MNLPSIIQCGASPRRPLLEYLPSLGRGTTIHLRIGHPYISPADVRPSNGFGSLAHNKDATVVVPAVAAVGRPPHPPPPPPTPHPHPPTPTPHPHPPPPHPTPPPPPPPPHPHPHPPIVRKLHYVLSHCVCMLFLFGWPPCQRSDVTLMEVSQHALDSLYIRSIWLLYIVMFFVNLIWYLYLFWLNKHCLSLSLRVWVRAHKRYSRFHYNDVTWTARCLISPTTRLFIQQFVF